MKIKLLAAALLFFVGTSAMAQHSEILSLVKATNNAIASIESNFSQRKTTKLFNRITDYAGKLVFDNNLHLDMDYSDPKGKRITIDGNKFTMKNSLFSKTFDTDKNRNMRILRNTLLNSFAGNIEAIAHETDSNIEYNRTADDHVFKIFTTKEDKPYYCGFIVYYNVKTLRMSKITIVESSGNYTDYTLTGDARINLI